MPADSYINAEVHFGRRVARANPVQFHGTIAGNAPRTGRHGVSRDQHENSHSKAFRSCSVHRQDTVLALPCTVPDQGVSKLPLRLKRRLISCQLVACS